MRRLFGGVAGVSLAGASGVPGTLLGQQPAAGLTSVRLGPRLQVIAGAGGNVVVLTSPEGVVLVNGGEQARSADLLALVASQSGGVPVTTLFNTDWHHEHTGSNETLGKAGVRILAHEYTKQYLAHDQFVDWQNQTYKARARAGLPNRTFLGPGSLAVGGERVEYGPLGQAHTDGDIYVYFRDSNVLVAGDVFAVGRYPIADYTSGGWLGGLVTATRSLLELANAETRVVPGTGAVQTKVELQAQFDMLTAMRDRLPKLMRQGMSAEDMLAAGVTKDFDPAWGRPNLFVSTAYRGLWLHVRELGGIV